jgi:hypothetical protein
MSIHVLDKGALKELHLSLASSALKNRPETAHGIRK